MKTTEMKETLYNKLKAENCYFTKSDIGIKKESDNKYIITIKDYEPFNFIMKLSIDDDEYEVIVSKYYKNEYDGLIAYETSKKDYDIKSALIELGYYIGTRF